VLGNVYEGLVGLDSELKLRPVLAENWSQPEPDRWRFRLHAGRRFHDGTPLTAAAVRDALLAIRDPDHDTGSFLASVREVSVVDELTLDMVTVGPRALLSSLAFLYVAKPNASEAFPPFVGTGPYRLTQWNPGRSIVLERWGEHESPGALERVTYVPVTDPGQRLERLRRGTADVAYAIEPAAAAGVHGVRLVSRPSLTVFYLAFDLQDHPGNALRDRRVREAFHLAVDRRALVAEVHGGRGVVATQPVAQPIFGYLDGLEAPTRDAAAARRLLAEAGHPDGLHVRLLATVRRAAEAAVLERSLAEAGIRLQVELAEPEAFYTQAESGDFEVLLAGWDCASGEASEAYEFLLHTPGLRYGQGNYGRYSNPEIDRIAESNATLLDPVERRDLLQQAARIVMQDLPIVPLFTPDDVYGVREGWRLRPRADSIFLLSDLQPVR